MKIFDDEKDLLLDHEYDGIRELDNHMPTWWLWLFYVTIAFSVGYMVYYYMLGGPDQHELYEMEMAAAEEKYNLGDQPDPAGQSDFTWTYSDDPAKIEEGKELFMSNATLCFTCHGGNGEGLVGPNLTDQYWIHGCSAEEMATSISQGFPDKGMMPYGSGQPLSNEKLQSLISYIATLQGTEPANAKAADMNRAEPCTIEP